MSRLFILSLIAISLTSCSIWPYRSDFDCKIPEGEHCKSLYEINKMADTGKFDPNNLSYQADNLCSKKSKKKVTRDRRC